VVDPFAGGGAIPLEALRVGADAFASDLNPVAVLLNKVVLEYIPRYGEKLAEEVRKWGNWIKEEAEKELSEFYPKDADGATPIAYLWARTVICEGPACGAEIPLMRSLWLAKKTGRAVGLQFVVDKAHKHIDFDIIKQENRKWTSEESGAEITNPNFDGTVKRGNATCPVCGFTTKVTSVRRQLSQRNGGANDARLFCVVTTRENAQGRFYRLPEKSDLEAVIKAQAELEKRISEHKERLSLVPNELTPRGGGSGAGRAFSQRNYGMEVFADLFTARQNLALTTLSRRVREVGARLRQENDDVRFADAIQICLTLALGKQADSNSSLCAWRATSQDVGHTFGRQALPMLWDFVEPSVISGATRDWNNAVEGVLKALQSLDANIQSGEAVQSSATNHPLPDDSIHGFITDPPYYDAVPYSDLSDFFYVWLKRTLPDSVLPLFSENLAPKGDECIVDEIKGKDREYFEKTIGEVMAEGRRILEPNGIGLVVFAHKTTSGWEALLQAMVDAGWIITASWAIDTEMGTRLRAQNSAALASSVHLVCRPRENSDGSLQTNSVGEWSKVLQELPKRIHEWLPRLRDEGIVGADAIFACLGPALEIFSRYERVEKSSGEVVPLRDYLESVWAAVSKEALQMIFTGADASGFEPDARLTAMWLWTLFSRDEGGGMRDELKSEEEMISEDEEETSGKAKTAGFSLEFDTARKIAQGMGINLEELRGTVEIKGELARLLAVKERSNILFGNAGESVVTKQTTRKKSLQQSLFAEMEAETETSVGGWHFADESRKGDTVLDRLHQAMLFFAANRSEALKRFLVEDGVGQDERFWRLANALSALYPTNSEEKRWVDGILARKKGLGF
jgi:adenine-specific DNA methylase